MNLKLIRRAILPVLVAGLVVVVHFGWLASFPERAPEQDRWAAAPAVSSPLRVYVESQSYWLGYSYALSLAFASVALRRYREGRLCSARSVAIGGVTFSGLLAVAGCYLLGCCGSPMLAVYASLLGTAFLPFTKPLLAALTTVFVAAAWWWMNRRGRAAGCRGDATPCDDRCA